MIMSDFTISYDLAIFSIVIFVVTLDFVKNTSLPNAMTKAPKKAGGREENEVETIDTLWIHVQKSTIYIDKVLSFN